MNLIPNKIPRKVYAMFGEFIVLFNVMDFKFKHFLGAFVEDPEIGYLLTSNQSFDFTRKRVDSIFKKLVDDQELLTRWTNLQADIITLSNVRNDFAHSVVDFDNVTKSQFLLTRYNEKKVLQFQSRRVFYTLNNVKAHISDQKKTNKKISYLFHTTFKKYNNVVYYSGNGTMF